MIDLLVIPGEVAPSLLRVTSDTSTVKRKLRHPSVLGRRASTKFARQLGERKEEKVENRGWVKEGIVGGFGGGTMGNEYPIQG